jgi:dTDP-4-dehydrorhamnose 3,5-epimerase
MSMEILDTPLAGLKLLQPKLFGDSRGYFLELHNQRKLENLGFSEKFVQDNLSFSRRGTLRGLHYQYPSWQGKLVSVITGEIYDAVVDIRRDSPTFGQWYGITLSADNHTQLYVPPGFAHGFCVTSDTAHVMYKVTNYYNPADEQTLMWNDPALGIPWPVRDPILSAKDTQGRLLRDLVLPG